MVNYLRSAGLWNNRMKQQVEDVLNACKCRLDLPPSPHKVTSVSSLSEDVQTHLAVDVICLGGQCFLLCIDHVTGGSEVGLLCRRDLVDQVRVIRLIQILRHGMPRTILSDREYGKGDLNIFWG